MYREDSMTDKNDNIRSSGWIDISVPLKSGMVHWPDHPPVKIEQMRAIERGDNANLSTILMTAHTGTHIDAPLHFLDHSADMSQLSFDTVVGPARVIETHDKESVRMVELRQHNISQGERILFKTQNSIRCWKTDAFIEDYVSVSKEAAQFLVDVGVSLIGIDYLSVAPFGTGIAEVHRLLLGAGIWLLEGIDLSGVSQGNYELICLPLKLDQSEGAPARAIIRRIP
jgi:arylformamidase